MRTPQKNNHDFLAQLRKSHAAFTARAADFADWPIDLAAYDQTIDEFEAAVTDTNRYETETLAAYATARAAYQAAVAAARATFTAAKETMEAEKTRVRETTKLTREKAAGMFFRYQNIAEAVYLGSSRADILGEFDTPAKSYTRVTPKVVTEPTPTEATAV